LQIIVEIIAVLGRDDRPSGMFARETSRTTSLDLAIRLFVARVW
jgi:hypothetical protein